MLFTNRGINILKGHEEEYSIESLNSNDGKYPNIDVLNIHDSVNNNIAFYV